MASHQFHRRDFLKRAGLSIASTLLLPTTIASFLAGCASYVTREFSVSPRYICEGQQFTVSWKVEPGASTPSVYVMVNDSRLGVGLSGEEEFSATEDVRVELVINGRTYNTEMVTVIPRSGRLLRFTALGECVGAIPRWVIVNSPENFPPNLQVNEVVNATPGRLVTVSHAGVTVGLHFTGSTADFAGQHPSGDWLLSTPVELDWCRRGDVVGEAEVLPPALSIDIGIGCD